MTTRILTTPAEPPRRSVRDDPRGDSGRSGPRHADPNGSRQGGSLSGLTTMIRFMLRRDRWRLPLWVLGLAALTAYFANAIGTVMDDEALASMTVFAQNPIMGLISGPGYGFDEITLPRFITGVYGVFLMLGAAMMNITTISRHTRVEEQTGRAELIRANVTGRNTQLIAALVVAVLMNAALSVLMTLAFRYSAAEPEPLASVFLFSLGVGAVGCVFAAVTAVSSQFSAFARAGSGIAGAVLAAAFVIRGLGDMSAVQDGDLKWLTWLSPLGWAQQTAPFVLDRWWPLILHLGLFAVLVPIAVRLQSKRDLAAGILADRLGRERAAASLSTPLGLALRLQRSNLVWWSVGVFTMGVVFGSFTGAMADSAAGMPPEIVDIMGGAAGIVDGYIGYMAMYFAMIITAYAVLAILGLRSEEQGVRTEPVLATAVGRSSWLLSWTCVTALGALWLMLLAGVGDGLGATISTGEWALFGPSVVGHTAQTASVWVFLALALALYGFAPRLMALTWIVFVYSAVMTLFGQMLQLDEEVLDTSVFRHVGQYPAQDLSAEAVLILIGVAAVLVCLGVLGFRRRNLITA